MSVFNFQINFINVDLQCSEFPRIIQDTSLTRVWFKQDDKFLLPKADLKFDFVRY